LNLLPLRNTSKPKGKSFNEKTEELIKRVSGDILYLDPPYNQRQYATNYHILETISRNDEPFIYGKTGIREYSKEKSDWCSKPKIAKILEETIKNSKFKFIFMSYNDEGILELEEIKRIFEKYGKYSVKTQNHRRYKADSKRKNQKIGTLEYLHCLVKG
jgi:adenine-specific DNA-methyltransferase